MGVWFLCKVWGKTLAAKAPRSALELKLYFHACVKYDANSMLVTSY